MTHTRAGHSTASAGQTRRRGIRLISAFAAAAVLVTGTVLGSPAPAQADDYPTWADVEAARNNVSSTESKVSEVRALIRGLEGEVERTQAEAEAKGNAWQEADTAYQAASLEADNLKKQADDAAATADESSKRAGQMAAQLARTGGGDLTANLFANAEDADELLYSIGMSGKLSQSAQSIYITATQDRNNAQQLNEQAVVARDELEELKNAAEAAFAEAQAASAAADAALVSEEENRATLEAQLAFLNDESTRTAAEYQKGVEERARIEAERQAAIEAERQRQIEEARRQAEEARRAAEEAARRAAEEAAANPPSSGGGGGGGSTGGGGGGGSTGGGGGDFAGVPVASGWVKPASGYVTSSYGGRLLAGSTFHKGTDLSGGGCGGLIYAANSGTVSYAAYGYNGGYGNYITINHGGNVQTAYGHVLPGGILVNSGQNVNAGDVIGLVGDTGFSFGCHLHYEVRLGGATTDPVPYMARQGVYF